MSNNFVSNSEELMSVNPDWAVIEAELARLRTAGLWMPGPAGVLDVVQAAGKERAHQLLIGWLLDPRRPHDLGTAVLAGLLAAVGRADLAAGGGPVRARVELEVVKAQSRADIVVTAPEFTLVIELKVHADEGHEQTTRLADDHAAGRRAVVLLFLTLGGDAPADGRFAPMSLRTFADLLRTAVEHAPAPRIAQTRRGRETAVDYLETLERMTGMAPDDQAAARIWLSYGEHLPAAREAARAVLRRLPAAVAAALGGLEVGEPVKVVGPFDYVADGHPNRNGAFRTYDEVGVLLAKPSWFAADGSLAAGIGFGARAEPDPFEEGGELRPFLGIRARDPEVNARLKEACAPQDHVHWDRWPRWEYLDLALPEDGEELVTAYAARAAERIAALWERNHALIDQAMAGPR
ncbi:PD-(D/E)XK nuclease family protein [Kitasatospora aureofaciens]|uniref:PD-(D/E)XK nuclease family protein n=1 Tax=Kitasatospora aureofaciens TaxID=1894 RepID=UPI003827F0BC